MTERVLVGRGVWHHARSTAEIAESTGATLREDGLDADVRPAAQVDDVSGYDGAVPGGAVCGTRWHPDATDFSRGHARALTG